MKRTHFVLLLLALSAFGCATAVPATRNPQPAIPLHHESDDLRLALEETHARIIARSATPANAPQVDLDAAMSIPIPDHRSIRSALTYFTTGLKPGIQESLLRSGHYRRLIDRALDELKLPKGLAYLPVIESAYVPTLTSRAGAHGIWQFMPDTAREYGLRVDWWIDERADPERSTRAAAAYLKDLYRQFNDWPLALAAYNAGPGRIHRAMTDTGATTFWQLLEASAIPKETRGYVPTFFATLMIASDPASYGFRLGTPIDFEDRRVEVEGPLSLRYLAEVAHVDEALLKEMNPSLRRAVVPPGKVAVRVPAKSAETIVARAATLKNEDANVAVCSFTLRDGDSIRRLARAIGVEPETLLSMNNLRAPDAVSAGDSIYLPVRARELGALLSQVETYYAVRHGDTFYSIAKRYNLTIDELRELNDLGNHHVLQTGERLRVVPVRTVTAGGM